jgi:LysM repeat protein
MNNNPSPLIPEGSNLEQKNKTRARVRLTVFVVLSVLIVGLMGLLMQGCKKPPEAEPTVTQVDTNLPTEPTLPADTNVVLSAPTNGAVTSPAVPVAPAAPQEYTVLKGDSFFTIAKKFNVTTKQIQDANPTVQPTKLQIGQKLQIPAPVAPTSTAAPTAPDANAAEVYTVKSDDTLTKIAADHHTTVKAIRAANNLATDKIKVGQKLKMPPKASAPGATAPVDTTPAPTTPPAPGAPGQNPA